MLLVESWSFPATVTSVSGGHVPLAQTMKAGKLQYISDWSLAGLVEGGYPALSMHLLYGVSDPLHPHFFPEYIQKMSCVVIKLYS